MKKWQKITGIAGIALLAYAHIEVLRNYLQIMNFSGGWQKDIEQEWFVYYIDKNINLFWAYHILSFMDLMIILFFFICIWRKGDKR